MLSGLLIVSNHTGIRDIFAILLKRGVRVKYVDRTSKEQAKRDLEVISKRLRAGQTVWCFPDGTLTHLNTSCEWKSGVITAAISAGASVEVHHMDGFPKKVSSYSSKYLRGVRRKPGPAFRRLLERMQNEALLGVPYVGK